MSRVETSTTSCDRCGRTIPNGAFHGWMVLKEDFKDARQGHVGMAYDLCSACLSDMKEAAGPGAPAAIER